MTMYRMLLQYPDGELDFARDDRTVATATDVNVHLFHLLGGKLLEQNIIL